MRSEIQSQDNAWKAFLWIKALHLIKLKKDKTEK